MAAMPQFNLEDSRWWTATVLLPSWKGFQSRRGAYGSEDKDTPSDGTVPIVFAPEGRGTEPLTEQEIGALRWVIEHEESISNALTSSLLKQYSALLEEYDFPPEMKEELPTIKSIEDLRSHWPFLYLRAPSTKGWNPLCRF